MECYSAIKNNETMPFVAAQKDLESVSLSEVSQRRRNIIWCPLYLESRKKWYKWTYLQNRLTGLENELKVAGLKDGGEGIVREFGIDMYTLLFLNG